MYIVFSNENDKMKCKPDGDPANYCMWIHDVPYPKKQHITMII